MDKPSGRIRLPPSLDKMRHTLDEEVERARGLTPDQRLAVTALLCRDAMALLAVNSKRDRVLARRDPVPESTRRALARLRVR